MNVNYLVFRKFENAIRAALDTGCDYDVTKGAFTFGEMPIIYVYNEDDTLAGTFYVDEGLHAVSAYQEQGD